MVYPCFVELTSANLCQVRAWSLTTTICCWSSPCCFQVNQENFNIYLSSSRVINPRQLWKTVNELSHHIYTSHFTINRIVKCTISLTCHSFFYKESQASHARPNHICSSMHNLLPANPPNVYSCTSVTMNGFSKLLSDISEIHCDSEASLLLWNNVHRSFFNIDSANHSSQLACMCFIPRAV